MEKILITGSAGFIGKNFFNYLTKFPNIKLFGIINHNKENLKKKNLKKNIFGCDLSKYKITKKLIEKIKPSIIFHFAGISNHSFSEKNKKLCKKNNSQVIYNIIKSINSDCKLIFLSTDKVYAANPKISPQHTNLYPTGYLAKEKLKCEKIIIKNIKKYFIIRLPIVHQNGENKKSSTIDKFLFLLKKKKRVKVYKNIKRSFIRISQLNNFLKKLIYNENYGIYNAGSKLFSYSNRVEKLCRENRISTKNILKKINGDIKPQVQNFNTGKLKKRFNFIFD